MNTPSLTVGTFHYDGIVSKNGTSGAGIDAWKQAAQRAGIPYTIHPGKTDADILIGKYYRGIKESEGYHPSHIYLNNPIQAVTRKHSMWYKILWQFVLSVMLLAGFILVIAIFEAVLVLVGMGSNKGIRGYVDTVFRDIFVFLNGEFVSYPKHTADRLRLLFVSAIGIVTLATMTASTVQALLSSHSGMLRSLADTEGDVYIVQKGSVAEVITRDLGIRHETDSGSLDEILRTILVGVEYPQETRGVIATRKDIYKALHEDRSGLRQEFEVSPYVFGNAGTVFMIRDGLHPSMTRHINGALDTIHKSGVVTRSIDKYAPGTHR